MPRRSVVAPALAVGALLLSGCSGGSPAAGPTPTQRASTSAPDSSGGSVAPLVEGLDVCSLVTPAQVAQATGQAGDPSDRVLASVAGYDALVDQCGFGVSFHSYSLLVSVGLAPARASDLRGAPGSALDGVGDAARTATSGRTTTVTFVRGTTFVQVRATRSDDGAARPDRVATVAAAIARAVPADPPETDEQTTGVCAKVDARAVREVLGADPGVSRSFVYPSGSATCSWATSAVDARLVTVAVYTNAYAGPFLADLRGNEPTNDLPGFDDAFTNPGIAYAIAGDGQAVSVGGTFPPRVPARTPLPVTPQLKTLLGNVFSLLQ